eukprot:gnl/MRDRNA2_/MRDRNA2_80421_c0_seq3.p1 gnl/MRDRNA2_/MRDRNA2_80421_c0~~gnl/MRDRNA2_/MRDRNA2_80421_c0_seq3.p1  ORF type:complete len:175 (+),score=64.95 gnl/MRDRNA2_/MRDRNA2_80421_c0_seq3:163-687(+)
MAAEAPEESPPAGETVSAALAEFMELDVSTPTKEATPAEEASSTKEDTQAEEATPAKEARPADEAPSPALAEFMELDTGEHPSKTSASEEDATGETEQASPAVASDSSLNFSKSTNFSLLKVFDLRAELRKRGLSTAGKKDDLIQRLEGHEDAKEKSTADNAEEEGTMSLKDLA